MDGYQPYKPQRRLLGIKRGRFRWGGLSAFRAHNGSHLGPDDISVKRTPQPQPFATEAPWDLYQRPSTRMQWLLPSYHYTTCCRSRLPSILGVCRNPAWPPPMGTWGLSQQPPKYWSDQPGSMDGDCGLITHPVRGIAHTTLLKFRVAARPNSITHRTTPKTQNIRGTRGG